ncbi:MAG: putative signal transducing protein [Anaerovoracaceae bacterium]
MGLLDRPDKNAPWRGGVYLTTATSSLQADILESKLAAEGIPCVKNYRGMANLMEVAIGTNSLDDIDIYVPEEDLERAKEVIVPVPIDDDFEEG